jgi:acyl-CoA reductase-like NAD-dependent aldehyde dehydrogenase
VTGVSQSIAGLDLAIPHAGEFFIGGRWVPAAGDGLFSVVNPSNEAVLAALPEVSFEDVDRAVSAARLAFDSGVWSNLTVAARAAKLRPFTDALLARKDQIGDAWGAECGPTKAFRDAINGIVAPVLYDDAYATAALLPESEERTGFAGQVTIVREPFGVAVTILTYNGPLAYLGMKVLPALLSGNTVVLKLPVETRLVAQFIAQAAAEADLPAGVINVLPAGADASQYLVEHPGVDLVSFTGGTTVGSKILHSTADRIVKTTLELGGKSAGIVADDIPLPQLIGALLPGLIPFQGQVCVAITRLLVSRQRHDEIVGALAGVFGSLKIGDAMDPTTDFGPVAVERTRTRCEQFVEIALKEGAEIAYGGKRPAGLDNGWFFEPTLLTNVRNEHTVAQEEVFGPVFTVITYDDIDDAIRMANDSQYGLAAAVYTNDNNLARSVARRVRAGSVTTNSSGGVLGQPFGGFKRSGFGREMGIEGFREWATSKVIKVNDEGNFLA